MSIKHSHGGLAAQDRDAPRQVRVRVVGGYEPNIIRVEAGLPLRLVFWRNETSPCSEQVLFPAFGKSAMLPWREEVAVDLLPGRPGEYEFSCGMGMLHGTLVVVPQGEMTVT